MQDTSTEIPLDGGMMNPDVVRVGDTVHRAMGKNAAYVHAVLTYLATKGFAESPRFLGVDSKGREVLTFFEGIVYPGAGHKINDRQLIGAAKLIRRYHDLTAGSSLAGRGEIIAHGELGPHNTVYQGDIPVAIIDWDSAAPGTRLRDFAYAVDCFTDFSSKRIKTEEQARRVVLMCAAYGWGKPATILRDIQADYQQALENHIRRGNRASIRIFTALSSFVDKRVDEIVASL